MYRDGKEVKVAASELVPGDLVRLYIGDRVPADIRMIESADLKVRMRQLRQKEKDLGILQDVPITTSSYTSMYLLQVECSSLTGESDLVPAPVECKNEIPEQSQCLVFMSTMCMNGEGRGIVVRTGERRGQGGQKRGHRHACGLWICDWVVRMDMPSGKL